MKRVALVCALVAVVSVCSAQFRDQVDQENRVSSSILRNDGGGSILFGWFDPSKFQMRHMVSMSYMTAGGQGLSLGTYTNMMSYQFSDKLDAQADVSMSYSPFNTFSSSLGGKKNDFSGIYLSRAQLNYRPWDNVKLQIQYRAVPYGYYYSPFTSPFSSSPWLGEPEF